MFTIQSIIQIFNDLFSWYFCKCVCKDICMICVDALFDTLLVRFVHMWYITCIWKHFSLKQQNYLISWIGWSCTHMFHTFDPKKTSNGQLYWMTHNCTHMLYLYCRLEVKYFMQLGQIYSKILTKKIVNSDKYNLQFTAECMKVVHTCYICALQAWGQTSKLLIRNPSLWS